MIVSQKFTQQEVTVWSTEGAFSFRSFVRE